MLPLSSPLSLMAMALAIVLASGPLSASTIDLKAAERLAKKSNCSKCHHPERKRESTPWREVAKKYKSDPEAEGKLMQHLTSGKKVKFEDGHEEKHLVVKSKDPAQIRNLVNWILVFHLKE